MLTPYTTGKTVVPGARAHARRHGSRRRQSRCRDDAVREPAGDRRAVVRGAVFPRRHRRAPQGHGARAALLLARRRRRLQPGGAAARGAHQGRAVRDRGRPGAPRRAGARRNPQAAPDLYVGQGRAAGVAGRRPARRRSCCDEGVARYPDALELRLNRAFHLDRSGKDDAAIRELRALLAERPGDAHVQNALGYTLADHDRNLAEARQLADRGARAVARQRGDARQHGLGAVPRGQVRRRRSSTCSMPGAIGADPEIDLHIGEVQWAMGDRPRPARPGPRRWQRRPTTRSCASGSNAPGPEPPMVARAPALIAGARDGSAARGLRHDPHRRAPPARARRIRSSSRSGPPADASRSRRRARAAAAVSSGSSAPSGPNSRCAGRSAPAACSCHRRRRCSSWPMPAGQPARRRRCARRTRAPPGRAPAAGRSCVTGCWASRRPGTSRSGPVQPATGAVPGFVQARLGRQLRAPQAAGRVALPAG